MGLLNDCKRLLICTLVLTVAMGTMVLAGDLDMPVSIPVTKTNGNGTEAITLQEQPGGQFLVLKGFRDAAAVNDITASITPQKGGSSYTFSNNDTRLSRNYYWEFAGNIWFAFDYKLPAGDYVFSCSFSYANSAYHVTANVSFDGYGGIRSLTAIQAAEVKEEYEKPKREFVNYNGVLVKQISGSGTKIYTLQEWGGGTGISIRKFDNAAYVGNIKAELQARNGSQKKYTFYSIKENKGGPAYWIYDSWIDFDLAYTVAAGDYIFTCSFTHADSTYQVSAYVTVGADGSVASVEAILTDAEKKAKEESLANPIIVGWRFSYGDYDLMQALDKKSTYLYIADGTYHHHVIIPIVEKIVRSGENFIVKTPEGYGLYDKDFYLIKTMTEEETGLPHSHVLQDVSVTLSGSTSTLKLGDLSMTFRHWLSEGKNNDSFMMNYARNNETGLYENMHETDEGFLKLYLNPVVRTAETVNEEYYDIRLFKNGSSFELEESTEAVFDGLYKISFTGQNSSTLSPMWIFPPLEFNISITHKDGKTTFALPDDMKARYDANVDKCNERRTTDEQALKAYTKPTAKIQSNDNEIIKLANDITKGFATDYEKAFAIHDWVSENIWYDFDKYYKRYAGFGTSALDVLKSRITVCEGYTNLNAALLRAVGIPTRYISGPANGIGGWELHAWNEAYIDGRWVIIDTTWDSRNRYEHGEYSNQKEAGFNYFDTDLMYFSFSHIY